MAIRSIDDSSNRRLHSGAPRPRGARAGRCRNDPVARDPGDSSGEATPVPIPNTVVKLSSAEDTERAAFREHRSSPGFLRSRRRFGRILTTMTRPEPLPPLRDAAEVVAPPGRGERVDFKPQVTDQAVG